MGLERRMKQERMGRKRENMKEKERKVKGKKRGSQEEEENEIKFLREKKKKE